MYQNPKTKFQTGVFADAFKNFDRGICWLISYLIVYLYHRKGRWQNYDKAITNQGAKEIRWEGNAHPAPHQSGHWPGYHCSSGIKGKQARVLERTSEKSRPRRTAAVTTNRGPISIGPLFICHLKFSTGVIPTPFEISDRGHISKRRPLPVTAPPKEGNKLWQDVPISPCLSYSEISTRCCGFILIECQLPTS